MFRNWFILVFCLFVIPFSSNSQIKNDPPKDNYKVLMLLPFASPSHRNCFMPLAEGLANRGHKVYMITPLPPKSKNKNVIEINHGIDIMKDAVSMFEIREQDQTGGFAFFKYFLPKLAKIYDHPQVMELYNKRDEFDLMIIDELFNEPAYPFLVGKNYAAIATAGIYSTTSAVLGNVLNPSYVPSVMSDYPRPYTFIHRISNLFGHLYLPIYWRVFEIYPLMHKILSERFPDLPPLAEIEKGLSLVLANTHYSLDIPLPLLPSQVEVGGMHCHPAKPLPKDLQTFIDGSGSDGVIYFSLGSVTQGTTMPEKYRKILLEAFSKLKQRVIWKFEREFENLPENIIVRNWLPQQDILGHPNVKLFITHGGLLSMQEAIYHGKPLLAIPIFGDQVRNGERMKFKEFGDFLVWEDLTVELVISKIHELVNNPKYKSTIENVSNAFRDQQIPPLEKAIWWTEYVIRNKGAPQLRSPARDLCWTEYLMIDILALIIFVLLIIFLVLRKLGRVVCRYFCKTSSRSENLKRKRE